MNGANYLQCLQNDSPKYLEEVNLGITAVPDNEKFKRKVKFEDTILVWCVISLAEASRPYVGHFRGEAITTGLYIQRYSPKLLLFINEHHINDEIMFWPDLASCHYARQTKDCSEANNIPFVPKEGNPPNIPQTRLIEDALLSRKVYDNGWEAENTEQIRRRIYQKIREIDVATIQSLMRNLTTKIRRIEDHGPLAAL
ncbi:unnamed protein product [Psylliodes chrysocephalus]|uniref:Transposase n=1 Tax=Psylliodes chrysocephalus TaxID=3402493 RepID=A0A9P0CMG1_9CUCU|nr:unnamed protein product [Psylliodes chrysocephala]